MKTNHTKQPLCPAILGRGIDHALLPLPAIFGQALLPFLLALLASCSSGFMDEYSQDLSRVSTADDVQELVTGSCNLPLALIDNENSYYQIYNRNYDILHFMSDELAENYMAEEDPAYINQREEIFPYFCWQQSVYLDYKGTNAYSAREAKLFDEMYTLINNCNMAIKAADDVSTSKADDQLKLQRAVGEAYFLRAFYYFNLVNLYGKPYTPATAATDPAVPIKTTEYIEDKDYTRASVKEVYDQIIADLAAAEEALKTTGHQTSIYHADLNCVYLLRSRVALYMQDWQTAQQYAKLSLDQNSTLQNIIGWDRDAYPISKANPEVIYSNGSSCFGSLIFTRPKKSGWSDFGPAYYVSDDIMALYEDGDARVGSYISTTDDVISGLPTYHKIDNATTSIGQYKDVSDVFSLRTAEAYLNLAEADAHLGNDAEACQMLTKLRANRISGAEPVSLSGSDLVSFVRDERERELCFEGHRWFDLRRYMVDEQYPYIKEIRHTYTIYVYRNYANVPQQTLTYTLQKNDAAYTLDIPRSVREFQPSIGSNPRPARQPSSTQDYDTDSGSDDDDSGSDDDDSDGGWDW